MMSTCTHTPGRRLRAHPRRRRRRRAAPRADGAFGARGTVGGRCKLDPSLKATCFQPLNLGVHVVLST
eukprot:3342620-Pyramimonas_sp.AAC.1